MNVRDGIYIENTLGVDSNSDQIVQSVGDSDFNLCLLAFLHTRPNAPFDLFYNDTQIYQEVDGQLTPVNAQLIDTMAGLVKQLKSGFSTPKAVVMSMGPFQSDFDNISGDLDTFVDNLYTMATQLNLDGYDWDYEGVQDSAHQKLVAELSTKYAQKVQSATGSYPVITAAPYFGASWWAGVLKQSVIGSGNAFSWWNVQFYAGSSNPPVNSGAATFEQWESAVAGAGANIADPSAFIVPGVNGSSSAYPAYSPALLTQFLQGILAKYPDMGGTFLWNWSAISSDVSAWAQALYNAGAADRKTA